MNKIKTILTAFIGVLLLVGGLALTSHANETMDSCVGVEPGSCNTQIWYHDNDGDGVADYKATYAVVDGKLVMLKKEILKSGEFVSLINPR